VRDLEWRRAFLSEALSSEVVGFVLRVDCARWRQTPEDLRRLAMSAPHARTRERALALYDIAQASCATQVAERTGRHPQTVMGWLHAYNAHGPEALTYRRTGGRPPFVPASRPISARLCARPSAGPPNRP
jgi:hypothetical protein